MKFLVLSLKRNILPLVFVLIAIFLVIFSRSNLSAAKSGLTLWATCVVPSLFPFFVITNILSQTKVVHFTGRLLDRLMRPLFNVPGIGGFAFVMGLISGYPVGAKVVADFRENNLVTKDEGERMLAFTNNSGPLFILSSVGIGLFGDTKTGLLLLATHILSCITVGIILGKFSKKSDEKYRTRMNFSVANAPFSSAHNAYHTNISIHTSKNNNKNITLKDLGEVIGNSISSAISTILLIGGFVVIFSVVISILNKTHTLDFLSTFLTPILSFTGFDLDFAKPLLSGIIELTNGVNLVANVHIKAISQNIIICAFLLGFGGFSVLLQVFSIASKTDLSMKKYFIGKLIQGIIAAIYTFLALKFIPFINLDIIETSATKSIGLQALNISTSPIYSFFYDFGIFVISVSLIFIIFRLFKKLDSK